MFDRRIVVAHGAGPKAGLKEIAGLSSQFNEGLPSEMSHVNFGDRIGDVKLERVEETYALYREVVPAAADDDGA